MLCYVVCQIVLSVPNFSDLDGAVVMSLPVAQKVEPRDLPWYVSYCALNATLSLLTWLDYNFDSNLC